jgi:hypothetical protein
VSIFDRIVEYSNISKPSERVPKEDGGMRPQLQDTSGERQLFGKGTTLASQLPVEDYVTIVKEMVADKNYVPTVNINFKETGRIPNFLKAKEIVKQEMGDGFTRAYNANVERRKKLKQKSERELDPQRKTEYLAKAAERKSRRRIEKIGPDVSLSPREAKLNLEQRKIAKKLNEGIRKNPDLILKNEALIDQLSTTIDKDGNIIKVKPSLTDIKNRGIYEIEHQRDIYKTGKMKDFPYNRNLILGPYNRTGGFKEMAEKFIEKFPDPSNPKVQAILEKADELGVTIRPNVPEGTFPTKALGYKQLPDPIEKFKAVAEKVTPSLKSELFPSGDLNKLIASLSDNPACAVFAGKRGKFDLGGSPNANIDDCLQGGIKVINSGKIPPNKASQFANFTKKASTLGKNIMKFGIIPEAIFVGADSLVRMGLGDTFKEAGLRASDYLLPGDQTKEAEMLKVKRTLGDKSAEIVGRAIDYRNQLSKIDSLKQEKQFAETLSPTSEFDYLPDRTEDIKNIDTRIKQAESDLTNKFMIPEKEKGYAERAEQEAYDISKAKSPFVKALSYLRSVQPVENDPLAETAPEKQIDLSLFPTLPTEFMEKNNTELISYTNKLRELGYEVTPKEVMAERDKLKKMPLEQMAQEYSPEQIYGTQGEGAFFGEPLAGGGIAKLAGVSKGPPPESGPNPQGLNYLIKRVTNS